MFALVSAVRELGVSLASPRSSEQATAPKAISQTRKDPMVTGTVLVGREGDTRGRRTYLLERPGHPAERVPRGGPGDRQGPPAPDKPCPSRYTCVPGFKSEPLPAF